MTPPVSHRALIRRAQAARQLIRRGLIDPDLALSLVVWPTPLIELAESEWRLPWKKAA